MTLKESLYNSIGTYTKLDDLHRTGHPHKQSTIERALRTLVEEGKVDAIKSKGVNVAYSRLDAVNKQIELNKRLLVKMTTPMLNRELEKLQLKAVFASKEAEQIRQARVSNDRDKKIRLILG